VVLPEDELFDASALSKPEDPPEDPQPVPTVNGSITKPSPNPVTARSAFRMCCDKATDMPGCSW
jgi:hypothetical protein